MSVRNAGAWGEGFASLGRTISGIGDDLQETQDQLDLAKGRSQYLIEKARLDAEAAEDQEYGTVESRYEGKLRTIGDNALKNIRSSRARALFSETIKTDTERGIAAVRGYAFGKRKDAERGQLLSDLPALKVAAVSAATEDDAIAALETARQRLATARAAGYISATEEVAQRQDFTGSFAKLKISSLLQENDIPGAKKLAARYREFMSAETIADADRIIREHENTWTGMAVATEKFAGRVRSIFPTDIDRIVGITIQAESNGRRFGDDGKVLTSRKGARGEMQVMPATERDPGFGVRPAADDGHEERARVGRDYLGAMLKRYGSVDLAWGAYNAGPGAVDKAVKKGGANWLAFMPPETQAYVARNMAALEAGDGAPRQPTLIELQAEVMRDPRLQNNPVALKTALAQVESQFNDARSSKQQVDDEAVADAMEVLLQNGGRYSELPVSIRSRVPAEKRVELLNYAQRVAKGDDSTDPAVYLSLMDDRTLRSLSDQQFYQLRARLSESDFQQLAKERSELIQGGGEKSPQSVDRTALNAVLRDRLMALGVDASQAAPGNKKAALQRQAAITSHIRTGLLAEQVKAGHKFSDAEIEKYVDRQFARTANLAAPVPWHNRAIVTLFGDNGDTIPQQLITMRERDIPDDTRKKIRDGLKARGVEPTEGAVLGVYWDWKRKRGG
ncbi:hypothetical protein BSL82_04960 [Tardibacter chloracetimidivorans]|uniref:Transglycosylase SLT domain-containing protein n=1 Tax=Tardibacter chloracetimidivorans TaxID=1921510 RepID=A0A1L3ZSZ2_9SPHN|nr:hypothetical protein BSL82_04960 [Tardibacter chloracetimidivorans]